MTKLQKDSDLIRHVNIDHIADAGMKIYNKLKSKYDPKERGKYLAIDIDSKKEYFGETSTEAMHRARQAHPNKVFYLVKIGFDSAETLARTFSSESN